MFLEVRDGVLMVFEDEEDKRPKTKIPLYRCGMAEYDPEHPPPNLTSMFG